MFWTYILECSDGSYYTGHTDHLEKRIAEHITGAIPSCYTFNRRPLVLVHSSQFVTRDEALSTGVGLRVGAEQRRWLSFVAIGTRCHDWRSVGNGTCDGERARMCFDRLSTNGISVVL
jgi:predicted GIY-YIG superfamily endonuclease